jgi:hypothetical protein
MDLICGEAITVGVCMDISASGLRGTFATQVAPKTKGLLTLYHGNHNFQVHAVVKSVHRDEARIVFQFDSREEMLAIAKLIELLKVRR